MDLTLGLDAARALDPARYALGGAVPRCAVRPASPEEIGEALRVATRDGLGVVPWGGGVGLAHAAAPARYDVALDVTALDRIVVHEPEDFTITAQCGITIAALRAHLAASGQELPLEAALAPRATLGGVLSTNTSGARRLRLGAPVDRVLGARFALGDGTLARTGGRVVKNVAGYAVHRLLCGARGALAVMFETSLKLAPAPAARVALVWDVDAATLGDAARWAGLPRLEPAGLTVLGGEAAAALPALAGTAGFAVVLGLEDDAAWVERQAALARERLGPERIRLAGDEVVALWQALADLEATPGPALTFTTAANTPDALSPVLARGAGARVVFHAPAGRLHLASTPEAAPALVAALAEHAFTLLDARGTDPLDPALPPQAALGPLRERVRTALDPAGTFAFGAGWAGR